MGKYRAYPEYKDSGVEWLGKIPKHWNVCRLKHLIIIRNGQDYKMVQSDAGYPVIGSGGQFAFSTQYMYDKPSVLLGRKGTIDKPLYVNEPFWTVDTMYYTEMRDDVDAKYLYYLAVTIQFDRYSTSTALPSMTQENLGNYFFAVSNEITERLLISTFLDHETAKIDILIEKQQQLIKLLKEKRQAVISHAVTKGLNLDVPMKDSGVEWLGYIPSEWDIVRLKYIVALTGDKAPQSTEKYVGMENISSKSGKYIMTKNALPEGVSNSFKKGDVLFGKLRPYLAKSWLAEFSGICSSEFLVLHSLKVHPKFLNYYMLTDAFIDQVNSSTYGSKMPRASWDFIGLLPVPITTYKSTEKIANFLGQKTSKIDMLLEKQQKVIKLLQERRTSLISAAVTGKIDIRNWQAPVTHQASDHSAYQSHLYRHDFSTAR
ncbi:Type I restriction-modification [Xenorhabdus nematophila ATCC 19061]|uniref:Type I restriction-modification n=1 Tax=Xenorhabdus nematophila (strain ATCC 19061 / DSM 3370 / CCUG 14189 / LMG 1036 / NCIMB 9965 / AN6) TaxID=406817 RepID=D3VBW9_XENNA|nr:restriction endonuclease subunit S [Xenorhabdus nematophila]CBJ91958.1 Type I restriction-modification [Xenorhabdus nematophila ATCC 19061]CEK24776.1 Type I restriction-modification [Xenorhabdus nematophila AN6/1]